MIICMIAKHDRLPVFARDFDSTLSPNAHLRAWRKEFRVLHTEARARACWSFYDNHSLRRPHERAIETRKMSNGSVASAQWRPPPPAVGGSAKGPSTPAAATTTKTTNGQPVFLTTVTADSAYLTAATYERMLSEVLSLANNPSALTTFESRRSQACGLITAVGGRLGLPVRTIDTAFVVWQKCGVQLGASSGTTGQVRRRGCDVAVIALWSDRLTILPRFF